VDNSLQAMTSATRQKLPAVGKRAAKKYY
jgi:hypothetical protein